MMMLSYEELIFTLLVGVPISALAWYCIYLIFKNKDN
jgi:hypothetical protein